MNVLLFMRVGLITVGSMNNGIITLITTVNDRILSTCLDLFVC
jgi:hypothetical protein